ncbi:MAG: tripartite tricarboxylate transporter TctB family protein [Variovorax sp.]
MQSDRAPTADAWVDVIVGLALIGLAAVLWIGSLSIGAPFFDPLGSAAVPRACAVLIAAFSLTMVLQAAGKLRRARRARGALPQEPSAQALTEEVIAEAATWRRRPWLAFAFVVLCGAYMAVMQWRLAGFRVATGVFVLASVVLLGGFKPRTLVIGAILALLLAIGGHLLFTRFFYIDLP